MAVDIVAMEPQQRALLLAMFNAGVAAVQAEKCLPRHLPSGPPAGRCILFALGKAAGRMARTAYDRIAIDRALIITPRGHMPADWPVPPGAVVIEAGHPQPDAQSLRAGLLAEQLVSGLGRGDRVIAMISGGGSALMVSPAAGVNFDDKRAINRQLLASGASISQINRVRASLSRLKGGGLARLAHPAQVQTFVISDVPGDDPACVASGPTCHLAHGADPAEILRQYGIDPPSAILNADRPAAPGGATYGPVTVCASAGDALAAMGRMAAAQGYRPILLGSDIEGDAVRIAANHARQARVHANRRDKIAMISGGETSVALRPDSGLGGRNLTYALSLAIALDGLPGAVSFAADSDGIDGVTDVAGAFVFPGTLPRAAAAGLDARKLLAEQNSYAFFNGLCDVIKCGPTGTNVNDLRVILIN